MSKRARREKRYIPIFLENEAETFIKIAEKNGIFTDREKAIKFQNNRGDKPLRLMVLKVVNV